MPVIFVSENELHDSSNVSAKQQIHLKSHSTHEVIVFFLGLKGATHETFYLNVLG